MTTATSTIEVDVPLTTAYNQWTQMESYPKFMTGVESVTQLDDARTHWKMNIGGVRREFDAEITEQRPDDHFEWQSIGELKQMGRVDFEPVDSDHTRVTLTLDWAPEGFVEKSGAALQVDDALVRADLMRFKDYIEDRGTADGAWRGEIPADSPSTIPGPNTTEPFPYGEGRPL